MAKVFLDSNIFLYAIGAEGPHRAPCREILAAAGAGQIHAVTSSEVLQEILHVRSRRAGSSDASRAVHAAAGMVAEVFPVSGADVMRAGVLLQGHRAMSARDAIHVAVMQGNHVSTIVSLDHDFDGISGIRRVGPSL